MLDPYASVEEVADGGEELLVIDIETDVEEL